MKLAKDEDLWNSVVYHLPLMSGPFQRMHVCVCVCVCVCARAFVRLLACMSAVKSLHDLLGGWLFPYL